MKVSDRCGFRKPNTIRESFEFLTYLLTFIRIIWLDYKTSDGCKRKKNKKERDFNEQKNM